MFKTVISTSVVASIFLMNTVQAATPDNSQYAVTGKLGTLGIGADLTYRINDKFNARLNINGGSVNADDAEDGIKYKGDFDVQTIGGLMDYHPMASGLRISVGIYNNGNELNLNATGSGNNNAEIGDRTYDITGANLATNVGFKSIAPYLGIGWGNAVKMGSKWRLSLDAGVLFQGTPEAKVTASGNAIDTTNGGNIPVNLATDPTFQAELIKEENNLNDELKDFKAYPVISLGVSYRF